MIELFPLTHVKVILKTCISSILPFLAGLGKAKWDKAKVLF